MILIKTLKDLLSIFEGKYLELQKTYRSSPEIIEYTNKILNLNHVNAIRKTAHLPVVFRKGNINLKEQLLTDINTLNKKYKSIAIITKDKKEAFKLYKLIEQEVHVSLIAEEQEKFHKELIIIPAYLSKGLEFDSVIAYNNRENSYHKNEKNLLYVACTRAQHELYVYN